jgi:hypothetical protein
MSLVEYWRNGGEAPVWIMSDPRRSDLELADRRSFELVRNYRWQFDRERYIGGVRPDVVDVFRAESPPAWFLDDSWHLNPEAAMLAYAANRPEATAYIRRRSDAAMLFIGGRHRTAAPLEEAEIAISLDGQLLDRFLSARGDFFFRRVQLPAGRLEGEGLARLVVSCDADDVQLCAQTVRLNRFELQAVDEPFYLLSHGWDASEYDPVRDRSWRWSQERSVIAVHHAGRELEVRIAAESPLRYFDEPPRVVLRAGATVLAEMRPTSDFEIAAVVTPETLDAAGGELTLETDKAFVPAERSGSSDVRRLSLRAFRVDVTPVSR